jgi:hypothetical protein
MSQAGYFALRKLYISGDGLANTGDNTQRGLCKASILSKHVRFLCETSDEVHVEPWDGEQGAGSA